MVTYTVRIRYKDGHGQDLSICAPNLEAAEDEALRIMTKEGVSMASYYIERVTQAD